MNNDSKQLIKTLTTILLFTIAIIFTIDKYNWIFIFNILFSWKIALELNENLEARIINKDITIALFTVSIINIINNPEWFIITFFSTIIIWIFLKTLEKIIEIF